jgi:uncharacterized protein
VQFEWDEKKRQSVIRQRGVDILYAALIFDGLVLSRLDDRHDYGEDRFISVGMVDGECFVVVHSPRDGSTRLITAWKGGRDERSIYQKSIAGRDPADEG